MYSLHFIFALGVFLAASDIEVADGRTIQASDYVYYKESGVSLKLHKDPASWRNARLACFDEGAVLASPENEDLLAAMRVTILSHFCGRTQSVFTGIHDTFSKGLFMSLEGSSLSDDIPTTWAPDKDSSGDGETCVSMLHNGWLLANKCTDELPFICYKKVPPAPPEPSCGPADNGYSFENITGSCYKFHKEGVYWREAFAACVSEGAHLAIINSDHEAEVLKTLFNSSAASRQDDKSKTINLDVVHIGFVEWGRQGGLWMTIHGQTLQEAGYLKWHNGEPNNKTSQFCGAMYQDGDLDDVNCNDGDPGKFTRSFICEKKPKLIEVNTAHNVNE